MDFIGKLFMVFILSFIIILVVVSPTPAKESNISANQEKVYIPQRIDSEIIKSQHLVKLMRGYTAFPSDSEMMQLRQITEDAWPKGHYYALCTNCTTYNWGGFIFIEKVGENWIFDKNTENDGYIIRDKKTSKSVAKKVDNKKAW